jgi:hypothetical protein
MGKGALPLGQAVNADPEVQRRTDPEVQRS